MDKTGSSVLNTWIWNTILLASGIIEWKGDTYIYKIFTPYPSIKYYVVNVTSVWADIKPYYDVMVLIHVHVIILSHVNMFAIYELY